MAKEADSEALVMMEDIIKELSDFMISDIVLNFMHTEIMGKMVYRKLNGTTA